MPPKTVHYLTNNDDQLLHDSTRYGMYKRRCYEEDSRGDPSLLLLLRNARHVEAKNTDLLLDELRAVIGANCGRLRIAGKDLVMNQVRDMYSNGAGEDFLNQVDAAILKAISQATNQATGGPAVGGPAVGGPATGGPATGGPATGGPATGGPATGGPATGGPATGGPATGGPATGGPAVGGPAVDTAITRLIQKHLNYDYVALYGSPLAALDELLIWCGEYLTSRYRYHSQAYFWEPRRRNAQYEPVRSQWQNEANFAVHSASVINDGIAALSGLFRLRDDPKDLNALPFRVRGQRMAEYQAIFERTWLLTVKELERLEAAVSERDGRTNNANLRDVFLWMTEYMDTFALWWTGMLYEFRQSQVIHRDVRPVVLPVFDRFGEFVRKICAAVTEREAHGLLRSSTWNEIKLMSYDLTQRVRSIAAIRLTTEPGNRSNRVLAQIFDEDPVDYANDPNPWITVENAQYRYLGKSYRIAHFHWAGRYNAILPTENFPAIREPPDLAEESQYIPPDDGGGGDDNDDDDSRHSSKGDLASTDDDSDNNGNTGNNNSNFNNNNNRFSVFSSRGRAVGNSLPLVSICARCPTVHGEEACPKCTKGYDDSFLSPKQRFLAAQETGAFANTLSDKVIKAMKVMALGDGLSTGKTGNDFNDILSSIDPELLDPSTP